jgi:hypothetical protein
MISNSVVSGLTLGSNLNLNGYSVFNGNQIISNLVNSREIILGTTGLTSSGAIVVNGASITAYLSPLNTEYIQIAPTSKSIFTGGIGTFSINGQLSDHQLRILNYSNVLIDDPVLMNNNPITGISTISSNVGNITTINNNQITSNTVVAGQANTNLITTNGINIGTSGLTTTGQMILTNVALTAYQTSISSGEYIQLDTARKTLFSNGVNNFLIDGQLSNHELKIQRYSLANIRNPILCSSNITCSNINGNLFGSTATLSGNVNGSWFNGCVNGSQGTITTLNSTAINLGTTGLYALGPITCDGVALTSYQSPSEYIQILASGKSILSGGVNNLLIDGQLSNHELKIQRYNRANVLVPIQLNNNSLTTTGNITAGNLCATLGAITTLSGTTSTFVNCTITNVATIGNIATINNSSGNVVYNVATGFRHLLQVNGAIFLNISSTSSTFNNNLFAPALGINTSSITSGFTLDNVGLLKTNGYASYGSSTIYNPSNTGQYIQFNGSGTHYIGTNNTTIDGQSNAYYWYLTRFSQFGINTASSSNGGAYFGTQTGAGNTMNVQFNGDGQNCITYPFGGVDSTGSKLNGQFWINSNQDNLAGFYRRLAMGWDGQLNCGVVQSYRYLVGGQQLRINPSGGEVRIGAGDASNIYYNRDWSWQDGQNLLVGLGNTPVMASGRGVNDTTQPLYWFPLASNNVGLRGYFYTGYNSSGGVITISSGSVVSGGTYGQGAGVWQQFNLEIVYVLNPADLLPRTLTVVFNCDDFGDFIVNNRFIHHTATAGAYTRYFYITDPYIRISASVYNTGGVGACQITPTW